MQIYLNKYMHIDAHEAGIQCYCAQLMTLIKQPSLSSFYPVENTTPSLEQNYLEESGWQMRLRRIKDSVATLHMVPFELLRSLPLSFS